MLKIPFPLPIINQQGYLAATAQFLPRTRQIFFQAPWMAPQACQPNLRWPGQTSHGEMEISLGNMGI